jgi:oligoribonuclease NrnB/cAMP/cGMP phosphodiesterase (DHH superfamily)
MNPLCIYHGNCADGFGSAWVVWKSLNKSADLVDFYAGVYGQAPPDVTDRDVYMVDFSYKRPVLLEMADKARTITILDHHKTAAEDLKGMPANVDTVFDMEHSGAILTWDYFYEGEPPQLLKHIEDRDLWRFALAGTREIQANVFSYPYDFAVWDELMARPVTDLIAEGRAIERKHHKDIAELLGVVTRRMVIGGHNVPVANLPYIHVSDAAHALAKGEPFAGCYWDTPKGRVFGLRSTDAGIDVSEIAKQYGGGGHRNASGFTLPYADAMAFEIHPS